MIFKNLDIGPMQAFNTKAQEELLKRIGEEFSVQAEEIGRKFYKEATELLASLEHPEYAGFVIAGLMRRTPRFAYIKHYKTENGKECEIEIDLLEHTFYSIPID